MQIFSYQPQISTGPSGTSIRFANTEDSALSEVGVFNGRTVVIAPDAVTIPTQPSAVDWTVESSSPTLLAWVAQTRYGQMLSAARDAKHAARNQARLEAETAGFMLTVDGVDYPIDSDEQSVLRITSAAAVATTSKFNAVPYGVTWTCADDRQLTLNADGMLALQAALVAHGQHCHDVSQTIKAAIHAAETMYELNAIDTRAGYRNHN